MIVLAGCPVCVANSVAYGWLVLAAVTLFASLLMAAMMAWHDTRVRARRPQKG
jgi:hypothetical protein